MREKWSMSPTLSKANPVRTSLTVEAKRHSPGPSPFSIWLGLMLYLEGVGFCRGGNYGNSLLLLLLSQQLLSWYPNYRWTTSLWFEDASLGPGESSFPEARMDHVTRKEMANGKLNLPPEILGLFVCFMFCLGDGK